VRVEVVGAHLGRLTVCDARALLGPAFESAKTVEVLVLAAVGSPFAGVVQLGRKVSGYGRHHAFICPRCLQPVLQLYVDDGALGCAPCNRRLSRRARERTMRGWNRLGGQSEDLLLRLVGGRGRRTLATLERAEGVAQELALGDLARGTAAGQRARLAIEATEAT
jgi:hypothetical protein